MRELAPAYFIAGQGDIMSGGFLAAALLPILGNMILNGGKNKRKPNQLNLPSFRGVLEVKSAVDGRIRFSIPFLKGNGQMAAQAEQQISRLKPVSQVSINTVTGDVYKRQFLMSPPVDWMEKTSCVLQGRLKMLPKTAKRSSL